MRFSVVPEIRHLQGVAGEGRCPFCLRHLTIKHRLARGHMVRSVPIACWRADCRAKYDAAYQRAWRAAHPEQAERIRKRERDLARARYALRKTVRSLGQSVDGLTGLLDSFELEGLAP